MSLPVATRTRGARTLYVRCVAWGVATGASTGALFGVVTIWGVGAGRRNVATPSLGDVAAGTSFGALLGGVVGCVISVIPSLAGGLLVTGLIRRRHPEPSSVTGLQRDLGRIFAVCVTLLTAGLLLAIFTLGDGLSSVAAILPYILVGDGWVALLLWRASASIARATVASTATPEPVLAEASQRRRAW